MCLRVWREEGEGGRGHPRGHLGEDGRTAGQAGKTDLKQEGNVSEEEAWIKQGMLGMAWF